MKKNMFPLLGIAFVVAIVSTGVFYGLFAGKLRSSVSEGASQTVVVATRNLDRGTLVQPDDVQASAIHNQIAIPGSFAKVDQVAGQKLIEAVKKGEPVTERNIAFKASGRIPDGMRAISIRMSDSTGLTPSIKPGTKVDLQAFFGHDSLVELRTILQDVEVLNVQPPAVENGPAILTVLARPQDADQIALADSGARIRVTLRNPGDSNVGPSRSIQLSSIFTGAGSVAGPAFAGAGQPLAAQSTAGRANPAPLLQVAAVPQAVPAPVQAHLTIQILSATSAGYQKLQERLTDPRSADSLQVVAFQSGTDTGDLVRTLAGKQELEVVATQRLTLDGNRSAVWNAGAASCQVRIQFQTGRASLRVQPEWTWTRPQGTESRRFDSAVPDGKNFLVGGLFNGKPDRAALDVIFPGHAWASHDLLVLVTTDSALPQTAGLAPVARGR
jgi:pilus assembly protein CpaB